MGVVCNLSSTINMPSGSPPALLILRNVLKIVPLWDFCMLLQAFKKPVKYEYIKI